MSNVPQLNDPTLTQMVSDLNTLITKFQTLQTTGANTYTAAFFPPKKTDIKTTAIGCFTADQFGKPIINKTGTTTTAGTLTALPDLQTVDSGLMNAAMLRYKLMDNDFASTSNTFSSVTMGGSSTISSLSATRLTKTFSTVKISDVSYAQVASVSQSTINVSLTGVYKNLSNSVTNTKNQVFVAFAEDSAANTANGLFRCYISTPDETSQATLLTEISKATDVAKYQTVDLLTIFSFPGNTDTGSYMTVSASGLGCVNSSGSTLGYVSFQDASVSTSANERNQDIMTPPPYYVYLTDDCKLVRCTVDANKNVVKYTKDLKPFIQASSTKSALYAKAQANPGWTQYSGNDILASEVKDIYPTSQLAMETTSNKSQSTNKFLVSPNTKYRLAMKQINSTTGEMGLVLQVSVLPYSTTSGTQMNYTTYPNSYYLYSVTVPYFFGKPNLVNKSNQSLSYILDSQTIGSPIAESNGTKTSYSNISTSNGNYAVSSKASNIQMISNSACASACTSDANCFSYTTYSSGGTPACILNNTTNAADLVNTPMFNPIRSNSASSTVYFKHKIPDPSSVNVPVYNVGTSIANDNTYKNYTYTSYTAYDPGSDFTTYATNLTSAYKAITDKQTAISAYTTAPGATVTASAAFALNPPPAAGGSSSSSSSSSTTESFLPSYNSDPQMYQESFVTPFNQSTYTGLLNQDPSESAALTLAQTQRTNIDANNKTILANTKYLANTVSSIDKTYKKMTGKPQDRDKYGWRDLSVDRPDTSSEYALQTDINILMLHQNSMYIVGSVTAATFLVAAILLAQQ